MHISEPSVRGKFRLLSRQLRQNPSSLRLHKRRINLASELVGSEPLQGALADFFYGCWYEVPFHANDLLVQNKQHLQPSTYQAFVDIVAKKNYVSRIDKLATGWSVLVTPSMQVPLYRLRTSRDYSLSKADSVVTALLTAHTAQDNERIADIEDDFFSHCIICEDTIAFMQVWFRLHKLGWHFDDRWEQHRQKVELFSK